ncbi:MAG: nicotinate-nucleotide diphosphorylase (carboxylating), partial [Candidatus Omnitrophota bacterium]
MIKAALREDIGRGDITTKLLFPGPVRIRAKIIACENGILCGLPAAEQVFKLVDKKTKVIAKAKDGSAVKKGRVVCVIMGDARSILAAERTALNFLGRLSGIATLTSAYVKSVRTCKAKIYDTRKTTPGLRLLEKYAVRCGGGQNHRMGLWD